MAFFLKLKLNYLSKMHAVVTPNFILGYQEYLLRSTFSG